MVEAAHGAGVHVRGTVSCALGCPYEGEIAPEAVARMTRSLIALGVDEVSIADTIGVGTPEGTRAVMEAVLRECDVSQVNGHFHDTYGRAIMNIAECLEMGIRSFDSSAAGLGGCPYAPGASGNVATEDLLALMSARGFETGVDAEAVREIGRWIRGELSAPLPRGA